MEKIMACAIAEDSELRNVVVKNLLSVSNQSFGMVAAQEQKRMQERQSTWPWDTGVTSKQKRERKTGYK
jgi:hypothetical protein